MIAADSKGMAAADSERAGAFATEAEITAYVASREAVCAARRGIARSANAVMVRAYWEIGRQANIVYENEAGYGRAFIENLARALASVRVRKGLRLYER